MTVRTTLLSFEVPSATFVNPVDKQTALQELESKLRSFNLKLAHSFDEEVASNGGLFRQYLTPTGSHATVRGYSRGLITIDIHEYVEKGCDPVFTTEVSETLEQELKEKMFCDRSKSFPAIRRGEEVDVYYPTVDERIIEYDIDNLVYEANSPYQNIKVCHSNNFGNMLILDGDPNLAESDILYSHSIMRQGVNDFTGKDVLILGGGDGGILNELRKENARTITMVDIDEMVINAARKFLRGACTDSLDNFKKDNYEVIVGDAVAFLKNCADEGRQFDFIVSDLTVVPITPKPLGDAWDFLRLILDLSIKVLKSDGKYLTHANAALAGKPIELFEKELSSRAGYKWNRKDAFIPSFHEVWTFYELERDSTS